MCTRRVEPCWPVLWMNNNNVHWGVHCGVHGMQVDLSLGQWTASDMDVFLSLSWTFTSWSVSVYHVAVRTIVLSRHGSNLARPVIIHDIIHGLIFVLSTPYCGFFWVSPDGNCAYVHWGSFTSDSKSVRRAIWFTWFSEPHDSVYGTWQSQAVTHPLMNRARRRLTSVIEQISMSERRIPYIWCVLL